MEALLDEAGGEVAGVRGELRVGPDGRAALERNAIRFGFGAAQEGRGDGFERTEVDSRVVPRGQQRGLLGGCKHTQAIDTFVGSGDGSIEHLDEKPQITLNGGNPEGAGVVFELQARAFFSAIDDGEHHLEHGTRAFRTQRHNLERADAMAEHERFLIEEEDGDFEGVAAPREEGIVDQVFERKLLVLVGAKRPGLHLGEQPAKGNAVLKPKAHHLDVHEETDEFGRIFSTVGAGGADGKVVLAGKAEENCGEDGEQQNVQGDVFADAKAVRARLQLGGNQEGFDIAGKAVKTVGQMCERVGVARQRDAAEVVARDLRQKSSERAGSSEASQSLCQTAKSANWMGSSGRAAGRPPASCS